MEGRMDGYAMQHDADTGRRSGSGDCPAAGQAVVLWQRIPRRGDGGVERRGRASVLFFFFFFLGGGGGGGGKSGTVTPEADNVGVQLQKGAECSRRARGNYWSKVPSYRLW